MNRNVSPNQSPISSSLKSNKKIQSGVKLSNVPEDRENLIKNIRRRESHYPFTKKSQYSPMIPSSKNPNDLSKSPRHLPAAANSNSSSSKTSTKKSEQGEEERAAKVAEEARAPPGASASLRPVSDKTSMVGQRPTTRVSPPRGNVLKGTESQIARSTVIDNGGVVMTPREAVEAKRQQQNEEKKGEMNFGGKGGSKKLKFKNFRRTKRKNLRK